MKPLYGMIVLLAGISAALLDPNHVQSQDSPPVSPPPESFFENVRERDREAAKAFYKKFINIHGLPVVASAEVADAALERTYEIVEHMLAGRPDIWLIRKVLQHSIERKCLA